MKKLILILAIVMLSFSCSTNDDNVQPVMNVTNSDFSGIWTGTLCGTATTLVITQTSSQVVINGAYPAEIINGDGFKSDVISNVIHSGSIKDGVLTYTQQASGATCSGQFTK